MSDVLIGKSPTSIKEVFGKTVPIFAILFPMFCLAIGKGYDVMVSFLYLFALISLCVNKLPKLDKAIKNICWVFLAYFILFVLSWAIKGGKPSYLNWSSRVFYAIPIIFLLVRYPASLKKLQYGIVMGAIIAGGVAIFQITHFDFSRAYTNIRSIWYMDGYMPIQSGDMAMTLGLLCLPLLFHHWQHRNKKMRLFCALGTLLGVAGSFLSGSRGGWLALPIVFLYLIVCYRHKINFKTCALTLFATAVLIFGLNKLDPGGIVERMQQAEQNVQVYQKGDQTTSIGIRFVLWKSAVETFEDYPIFGAGYPGRVLSREQQVKAGEFPESVAKAGFLTGHAHNQYLEALSVRGIIGFIVLMALFIVPCRSFIALGEQNIESRLLKEMGIITVLSVMAYGLTQAFFNMNSGVVFYSSMIAILCTTQWHESQRSQ